jgi:hypothetical protein
MRDVRDAPARVGCDPNVDGHARLARGSDVGDRAARLVRGRSLPRGCGRLRDACAPIARGPRRARGLRRAAAPVGAWVFGEPADRRSVRAGRTRRSRALRRDAGGRHLRRVHRARPARIAARAWRPVICRRSASHGARRARRASACGSRRRGLRTGAAARRSSDVPHPGRTPGRLGLARVPQTRAAVARIALRRRVRRRVSLVAA